MNALLKVRNLDDFEGLGFVCNKGEFELHKIRQKQSGTIYYGMIFTLNFDQIGRSQIINLYREINILPNLNHPSILNIVGYSPVDFLNETRPVIILEYCKYESPTPILTSSNTKKLITIYGIASSMCYLHSHNIIHRDLKLSNIFFDDRLFPKLTGFHLCKQIEPDCPTKSEFIKGTPAYLAPEVFESHEFSKMSDVYSFSMLIYEILSNVKAFEGYDEMPVYLRNHVINGGRPTDFTMISKSYENLIKKCWSQNPKERPTFGEIIDHLKNDRSFIIDGVDEEEFREYIKHIEESPITFDSERRIHQLDQIFQNELDSFCNVFNFRVQTIYDSEFDSIEIYMMYVNLKYFQKGELIDHSRYSNIYRLLYYDSYNRLYVSYSGKIFLTDKQRVVDLFEKELFNHYQLYHRCISSFVGYSPVDFDYQNHFVIVSEFFPNSSLDVHLKTNHAKSLDDTTKLIILYGIASGMLYLHSNDIIHRDLNPKNIFLDAFMFPKIGNFSSSTEIGADDENEEEGGGSENGVDSSSYVFNSNLTYTAPEIITSIQYSKKSDVYSFGMIMYEIIANEIPFFGLNQYEIAKSVTDGGKRPEFSDTFPLCYRNLISRCWSQNPSERPTFSEIVSILKTDRNFISSGINSEKYNNYIRFVEGENVVFEPVVNENLFHSIKQAKENDLKSLFTNVNAIDLSGFEIADKKPLGEGSFGQVFKIIDKINGQLFAAKILNQPIETVGKCEMINIVREIENSSELIHPSIVRFVGLSGTDFEGKSRLTIVSEFVSRGTLHDYISVPLTETQKLIIMYGIASGMCYAHVHNIIHRDLKPSNIFLDDSLHPKIGDFGLSKKIGEKGDSGSSQRYRRLKGTFSYLAPEVLTRHSYSEASDVYAFALIVFQILTGERHFESMNRYEILLKVPEGIRPAIREEVPECYASLVQRCWSGDPEKRMSFAEIVRLLKTDENFINEKVDKEEFFRYVNEVDGFEA